MTINDQLEFTKFKGIHTDLLRIGKCEACKVAYVWVKQQAKPVCSCGKELARTTFLSKLKLKVI